MARVVLTLVVVVFAASARAQSAYVAGTIGADVSRVTHTDANFISSPDGNETLSGSVRVGTAIGSSWGVELEFVQSGHSHDRAGIAEAVRCERCIRVSIDTFGRRRAPRLRRRP